MNNINNLLDNIHDGVLLYNNTMKVVVVNSVLKKLLSLRESDVLTLNEFLDKVKQKNKWLHADFESALMSGKSYTHDHVEIGDGYYDITFTQLEDSEEGADKQGGFFVFHDISQWRKAYNQLQKEAKEIEDSATHDPLTGLYNQRQLFVLLEKEKFTSDRNHLLLALLLIDLEDFAGLNDALGHKVGDALLREIATRLRESIQKDDSLVRIGGDEIVVVLSQIKQLSNPGKIADKIIKYLTKPYQIEGNTINISVSIGIACYVPEQKNADTLLERANVALHRAKKLGKNAFEYYLKDLSYIYKKRTAIERELRLAITKKELSLHYQPIIDLKTSGIAGAETLIRWNCPCLGCVSPEEFIPVAEEIGMIHSIGLWVLKNAIAQHRRWLKEKFASQGFFMAINVSPYQLRTDEFTQTILDLMESAGAQFNLIDFELTESAYMGEPGQLEKSLAMLHEKGARFSIDDFGTGYSSLSRLTKLPIHTLKIDKSFVERIGTGAADDSIVTSIIALAKSIGLVVVAEGVETKEQLDFLIRHDCEYAQGYYFSKPLPVDEMNHYFQEHAEKNPVEVDKERRLENRRSGLPSRRKEDD